MYNIQIMQSLKTSYHLYKVVPDFLLWHKLFSLLINLYFLVKISIVSEIHYNAQALSYIFKKGLFVRYNIRVSKVAVSLLIILYWSKDSNLIQCILLLFVSETIHFNLK